MPEFLETLSARPGKKVSLATLKEEFFALYPEIQNSPQRGQRLLEALQALQMQGALVLPAPASWEKVGSPPLPNWVTLVRDKAPVSTQDYAKTPWVPELGFWTALKPSQLVDALAINTFLLERRGLFIRVPLKERSLEIFGDEKKLDSLRSGDTLFAGRLPLSALGAFQVPLPLPYRQADAPGRPLLVVENHNSFWSFGEWNHDARQYAAVVYGCGEAFRSTGKALGQVLHEVGGAGVEYLGDLDPKGIRIPAEFNRCAAAGEPRVIAALRFYRWLLANGGRREKADCLNAEQTFALEWLGDAAAEFIQLWGQGLWIPQEALGHEQLSAGHCLV